MVLGSYRTMMAACLLTLGGIAFTGCTKEDSKPAAEGSSASASPSTPGDATSWEGKWYNAAEKMTIELKPNHVATLGEDGDAKLAEISWEVLGPEKIRVHMIGDVQLEMFKSDGGNLRDSDGAVWVKR